MKIIKSSSEFIKKRGFSSNSFYNFDTPLTAIIKALSYSFVNLWHCNLWLSERPDADNLWNVELDEN